MKTPPHSSPGKSQGLDWGNCPEPVKEKTGMSAQATTWEECQKIIDEINRRNAQEERKSAKMWGDATAGVKTYKMLSLVTYKWQIALTNLALLSQEVQEAGDVAYRNELLVLRVRIGGMLEVIGYDYGFDSEEYLDGPITVPVSAREREILKSVSVVE